ASIFLLIKQPTDYYIYYGIIVGSAIASSLWNNIILFREIPFSFRKVNWKRHLRYVWVTYLISLFYTVPLVLDNVILRLVSTASAVGLYAFSVKIVRTGANLLTDSFLVFFPRIVSLAKEKDDVQLRQKLFLNIQFIILLSVPMGAGLYLVADELTIVFFGSKFLAVADNLRLLAIFPFLKGVSLFLSNPVLIAHNREKNFLKNLAGGTIIFIGAAIWLGSVYNDTGICAALVLTELFMVITNYVSAKKQLPSLSLSLIDWKTLAQALLGSALFIPIVYLIRNNIDTNFVRLLTSIIACFAVYGLFLLIVRNSFILQLKNIAARFVFKK
ncbi:MAG: polysaccharide biosynthesis C-terminal domain-containing protein, partial [Chitinophagaceae bacterium]